MHNFSAKIDSVAAIKKIFSTITPCPHMETIFKTKNSEYLATLYNK